jgi:hypothetical protein
VLHPRPGDDKNRPRTIMDTHQANKREPRRTDDQHSTELASRIKVRRKTHRAAVVCGGGDPAAAGVPRNVDGAPAMPGGLIHRLWDRLCRVRRGSPWVRFLR